jgi:hypothetical protein
MSVALLLLLLAAPEPVTAVSESVTRDDDVVMALDVAASYRVGATQLSDMRVDADGNLYGQGMLVDHRLSISPTLTLMKSAKIVSELQLAAGYLAVDDPEAAFAGIGPPRDERARSLETDTWDDEVHVRKLFLEWRMPVGVLRLGRQTTTWGLGILANAGDDEKGDWGSPRFGTDRNFGDVNDRLLFATAPFAGLSNAAWAKGINLAIGGDLVVRDERGVRSDGDRGIQGVGVARYKDDAHEVGLYVVRRDAADLNDDTTKVWVYDLFAKLTQPVGDFEVTATGEAALIDGTTTVARNNAFTGELDVKQLGYVARVGGSYRPLLISFDVELGYASGDSNPNDRFVRNFTFDRDYNPSLILFEELRAAETVAAVAAASDPARVGYPSDSLRYLPTGGAVTNTRYLKPTARYTFRSPLGDLGARLAVLLAQSEEDSVDPFNTNLTSSPQNFQGGDAAERDLGVEVDLGLDYATKAVTGLDLLVSLQGGRFFPGDAFADAAGRRPDAITVLYAKVVGRFDTAEAR